jgi:C-methyltransferase
MEDLKSELKSMFTSYWYFLAVQKACQLSIFDTIAKANYSLSELVEELYLNKKTLQYLLAFLEEQDYIMLVEGYYLLSSKGELLTEKNPNSLKNACILWGEEHLNAWQNLDYTLRSGLPSFDLLYGYCFFNYLKKDIKKLKNYHLAMSEYAKDDYKKLPDIIDFSIHKNLIDVGGGLGKLVQYVAQKNPMTVCYLFDLEEVTSLIKEKNKDFTILSGSFFDPFPFNTDAIILSRVLHDWDDEKALLILENCQKALSENGKIYIIEITTEATPAHLLSLNMAAMCNSYERHLRDYQNLLSSLFMEIIEIKQLNLLQKILVCQCITKT